MFRNPPAEKKRVQEVRSVLVGEPDDEPTVFERPFPGDRTPDLAETAKDEPAAEKKAAAASEVSSTAGEETDFVSEVLSTVSEGITAVGEALAAVIEEATADDDAPAQTAAAVSEEATTEALFTGQGACTTTRTAANRPRKKRQKKAWKPGQMTALKQKAEMEE